MSISLMTVVWKNSEAEGSKLLLLLALADMANDEGYCWPSYETLSKKARISRTHAINLMKELIEEGWVKKEKRFRADDPTDQTSNGYWITPPQLNDLTTPVNPSLPPQLTTLNPPQLTPVNPNHHIEPPEETSINKESQNIFETYKNYVEQLTGLTSNKDGMSAIDEIIEMGATLEDIEAGYSWLVKNSAKPLKYYGQLIGPTKTSMSLRVAKKGKGLDAIHFDNLNEVI